MLSNHDKEKLTSALKVFTKDQLINSIIEYLDSIPAEYIFAYIDLLFATQTINIKDQATI